MHTTKTMCLKVMAFISQENQTHVQHEMASTRTTRESETAFFSFFLACKVSHTDVKISTQFCFYRRV